MAKKTAEEQIALWGQLEELQKTFPYTVAGLLLFASTCLDELIPGKPKLNRVQADILRFLFQGNQYRMVQAQRGQTKTALAGIYCAFMLIHNPSYRIVVFSQTGKRAKEIAGWVIKIFTRLEFLEFMLPDKMAGDKSGVEAFDVLYVFKGGSKEPSVTCYSIEGGAQGARADIILADDIESLQNSRSATGRQWLEEQSKEFASINQYGDIVYLGTPQNADSIYNNLPSRGYEVRIWTGRYPSVDELDTYGGYLAPMLLQDIKDDPSLQSGGGIDGKQGKPTCPEMFNEETLQRKELEFGKAKFDLQVQLNTRLSDAERYPLKLCDMVVAPFTMEKGPVLPVWSTTLTCRVQDAPRIGNKSTDYFTRMFPKDYEWREWDRRVMFIDPSGGGKNGDEMAYGIVFQLGYMLYLYDMGGVPGGYRPEDLKKLVDAAKDAGVKEVFIEDNYGNGAHKAALEPIFQEHWPVQLEGVWSVGQKELRIIDALEPVMSTHRLVVRDVLLRRDMDSTARYSAEKRQVYSGFWQFAHITRDKGCLGHDDRVEAVSGAVAQLVQGIAFDQMGQEAAQRAQEHLEWMRVQQDPKSRREAFQVHVQRDVVGGRNIFDARQQQAGQSMRRAWLNGSN